MPELIEILKPFFKEDVKTDEVSQILTTHIEDLKKGIDPLAGITKDNAWETINNHIPLKSIHDSKVTEAIEAWKKNNFDDEYKKRYEKEHPPEDEKDKALRDLNARLEKLAKDNEEAKRENAREKVRAKATEEAIKLLGQEAIGIVGLISEDTEEKALEKLAVLAEYIQNEKKKVTEEILKKYSTGPGSGGAPPATSKEKLLQQYEEAKKTGDGVKMFRIQNELNKLNK